MPFIEITDPNGQLHTIDSSDPELCADWVWEMVNKYAMANKAYPPLQLRMVALTVAGDDNHDRPDWIRGFPQEKIQLVGHSPEDVVKNFITRLQEHI